MKMPKYSVILLDEGDDIAAKDYILKMIPKIKRESSRTILKHLLKDDIEKIIKFTLMLWRICK